MPHTLTKVDMASNEPRGPRQILQAFRYSAQGLYAAWRHEASFRMEIYLATPLIPLGIYLGATAAERALMAGSVLLVPMLELLNGGLEAIVDKTTPELHVLAGRAKDMGSAAVFFAMMNAAMVWSLVLWSRW